VESEDGGRWEGGNRCWVGRGWVVEEDGSEREGKGRKGQGGGLIVSEKGDGEEEAVRTKKRSRRREEKRDKDTRDGTNQEFLRPTVQSSFHLSSLRVSNGSTGYPDILLPAILDRLGILRRVVLVRVGRATVTVSDGERSVDCGTPGRYSFREGIRESLRGKVSGIIFVWVERRLREKERESSPFLGGLSRPG